MFICEPCCKKAEIPIPWWGFESYGACEVCQKVEPCFEIHQAPAPRTEEEKKEE